MPADERVAVQMHQHGVERRQPALVAEHDVELSERVQREDAARGDEVGDEPVPRPVRAEPAEERHDHGAPGDDARRRGVHASGPRHRHQRDRDQIDERRGAMAHQDGQRARVVDERPGRQYERHEALPSVTPELRDQDAEEQRAEERQEELGDPPLVGTIELVGPSGDGDPRRQEAHQIQDRPVAPPREVERAHHEQRVVREQRDLGVRAAADEERRREPAADGHEREAERVLSIGEPRRADRDEHEQQERRRLADQLVVAERGVDRQIQDREAAARQDLPVCAISAGGEAMPDRRQHEAADDAHGDAHGLGDPVVVEGVLQKEGDAQHQDDGADPEQQTAANRGFERRMVFAGRWFRQRRQGRGSGIAGHGGLRERARRQPRIGVALRRRRNGGA